MSALTLRLYMDIMNITVPDLAKDIGRTRQNIDSWLERGATVELLDNGGIKIKTEKVVHLSLNWLDHRWRNEWANVERLENLVNKLEAMLREAADYLDEQTIGQGSIFHREFRELGGITLPDRGEATPDTDKE